MFLPLRIQSSGGPTALKIATSAGELHQGGEHPGACHLEHRAVIRRASFLGCAVEIPIAC